MAPLNRITHFIALVGGIVSSHALATLADIYTVLSVGVHLTRMIPVATVAKDTQFLRCGSGGTIRTGAQATR
ncbi:hypothetical protein [uncultured Tateyamaria sp.]|uniref:hypothetical protein n=1 Tax=uncultured Tateyamaria sp. TaxID=455651 RepID=UPI002610BC8B|nr:hypothetical protein [uncultured Tateyamaria sp.]